MHSVVYLRRGLRIEERYYSEAEAQASGKVDVLRILAVLSPANPDDWWQTHTLLIDLKQTEERLVAAMDKGTRYEARRAANKDNLSIRIFDSPKTETVWSFCDYYDQFACQRSLRPVFRARLEVMARQGLLLTSAVDDGEGRTLVQHAYLAGSKRADLLYSASSLHGTQNTSLRALIGRANRLLHLRDMLHFRQRGFETYDFGGIDVENLGAETTRITQFKMGFGGTIAKTYSRTIPMSWKGRLLLLALRAVGRKY